MNANTNTSTKKQIIFCIFTSIVVLAIIFGIVFVASLKTCGCINDNDSVNLMPDLSGMDFNEAVARYPKLKIINDGSEWNDNTAEGCILWQSIEANSKIKKGDEVRVKVSLGQLLIEMPDVVGQCYVFANRNLKEIGLETEICYEDNFDFSEDQVIRTDPHAGTKVAFGTKVILFISPGTPT